MNKSFWKHKYFYLFLLFLVLVIGLWTFKKKTTEAQAQKYKDALPANQDNINEDKFVRVFKVMKIDFKDELSGLIGTVKGSSFELKSSQEERLIKYHYTTGAYVAKGGLIAELDHTRTKAKLNQAELNYDRTKKLFDVGGAAKLQLDDATESVRIARKDYEDTFITAPKNGYVGEVIIQEGELVPRQNPILTFVSKEKDFYIETSVIERKMSQIKIGDKASIKIEALGDTVIIGEVVSVSPEATTESRMVPLKISVPVEHARQLKPGLSAEISICIYETNGLVIPRTCLSENKVLIVDESKKLEEREVVLGYETRDYTEIVEGLDENELIVLDVARLKITKDTKVVHGEPVIYEDEKK